MSDGHDFAQPHDLDFRLQPASTPKAVQNYQLPDYWLCAAIKDDGSPFHARHPQVMATVFFGARVSISRLLVGPHSLAGVRRLRSPGKSKGRAALQPVRHAQDHPPHHH